MGCGKAFVVCAALLTSAPAVPAGADAVADFYRDRQVTLLIGYAPGGAYDSFARTVARHLTKHIPGNPVIVPRNMPGAGSLLVLNYIANSAPKDGTELAAVGREMPTAKLFGEKNAHFEAAELNWIGNTESAATFCGAWYTTGMTSAKDMFERPLIVGATNGESTTMTVPLALNYLLGTKLQVIAGYPGSAEMHLAIQRGEIQGRCAWSWSSLQTADPAWVPEGKIRILMGLGLERNAHFPDAPTALELAPDEARRQALSLILSADVIARPYVAPPGVPKDRVAALRQAFLDLAEDAAFRGDVERQKLELGIMGGAEMERIIRGLNETKPEVVELARQAMKRTDAAAGK